MKTIKGKFILFDFPAFETWLTGLNVTRRIGLIQQHHTWKPDYENWQKLPDHFHWLESMEAFQMQNGFAQIAQNLTSFPDGTIALGRPFNTIPAGIKGANQYGICIEHLGNFDIGGDNMTEVHREAIIEMNTALLLKFKLVPSTESIVYHHFYDIVTGARWVDDPEKYPNPVTKSCPGTNFFGGNTLESMQVNFLPLL